MLRVNPKIQNVRALVTRGGMAEHVADNPGTRPTRLWEFDAPAPWDVDEDESAYLMRLGLQRPGELTALKSFDE